MKEIDLQVNTSLDRFFGDERLWQRVAKEVAGSSSKLRSCVDRHATTSRFRVQVPKPYPGVQYRKSKSLEDRYPRYAKDGVIVSGQVEHDGEWLRISDHVFLPMKVGGMSILEQVPQEEDENGSRWWACGPGGSGAEPVTASKENAEVVINQDGYLNIPEGLNQPMPWEEPSRSVPVVVRQEGVPTSGEEATAALAASIDALRQDQLPGGFSPEAKPRSVAAAAAARSLLREPLSGSLDAATRILADPINPFSDTPRGGSRNESPLRSRPVSLHA